MIPHPERSSYWRLVYAGCGHYVECLTCHLWTNAPKDSPAGAAALLVRISRQIVERQGERSWAEHVDEGQGTTVTGWRPGEAR